MIILFVDGTSIEFPSDEVDCSWCDGLVVVTNRLMQRLAMFNAANVFSVRWEGRQPEPK